MLLLAPSGGRSIAACTEPSASRVLHVRVYNQTTLTSVGVEWMLEVANRLWSRYGVSLDLNPGAGDLAIVLQSGSSSVLSDSQPMVLGTTLFSEGHATPYIRLSLKHSEAAAEDVQFSGPSFMERSETQRVAILTRILGVALAHELGHYLLDMAGHTRTGLLQKSLKPRDFVEANPAILALTIDQQHRLCPARPAAGSR
jgi:hypothetical protein